MDPIWLIVLLPLAAGSGWYFGHRNVVQVANHAAGSLPAAYFRGLNFLLNEQHDKALDVLVGALESHGDTVEVQLALGTLFRRRGELERATTVHQNLVAREGLEPSYRLQALFELAQDYYKAGLLDRAENLLLQVRGGREMEESANQLLLQIYDQEKEWDRASSIARSLQSFVNNGAFDGVIAQYQCEVAESAIAAGRYQTARSKVADALLADQDCVRALIQSGRLDALTNDHRSALAMWERVVQSRPELLDEVIGLVEQSCTMLQDKTAYQGFLERYLDRNRTSTRALMSMVDLLSSFGSRGEVFRYLEDWLENNPSIVALVLLLQHRPADAGKWSAGSSQVIGRLAGELVDHDDGYECRQCGFQGRAMHWQCPGCRRWNSILPRQLSI
jgi:lipopolysaccharide biosynthesis regulator YciM